MGAQRRTNPFAAARGDETAMRPIAKLIWTLAYLKHFHRRTYADFLEVCLK